MMAILLFKIIWNPSESIGDQLDSCHSQYFITFQQVIMRVANPCSILTSVILVDHFMRWQQRLKHIQLFSKACIINPWTPPFQLQAGFSISYKCFFLNQPK